MEEKLIKRLFDAVKTGEEGAGTLPAREAVKVRPKDWHRICDIAKEAYAASLDAESSAREMRERIGKLEAALDLALAWLVRHEQPDSRAVSDEFVAMASVRCGNDNADCHAIIAAALAALPDNVKSGPDPTESVT